MKASTAILAASTALLAGAAAWLVYELGAARAQAEESARLAQYLTNRVVELERLRATPNVTPGTDPRIAPSRSAPPAGAPATDSTDADIASALRAAHQSAVERPKTPAMQRVQRSQARANAKRMYADFAAEYGLSPEDTARLYELMADQEMGYMSELPSGDSTTLEAAWREHDRKFREQANELLGPDGADRLNRYQGSFSARAQISQLEDQLSALDMPMNADQRRRLMRAAMQDSDQFPMPAYGINQTPEQLSQAYLTWERDRNERLAANARTILSTEQMRYFEDLRQYSRDVGQETE